MGFHHPSPLIVCGYMRSGTTMCARILNNSEDIELQGEMPMKIAEPTLRWLLAVKSESNAPEQRFYRLCRSVLRDTALAKPVLRRGVRWFGHKMPRHERYFDLYEALFDHPQARPHYVYCIRNPFHVWRSCRVMPWNHLKDVQAFIRDWTRSVSDFQSMQQNAGGRVSLFNLDELTRSADKLAWLESGVLGDIHIGASTLVKPVESIDNSNSSVSRLGAEPPEIPSPDRVKLVKSRSVRRLVETYFPWLMSSGVGSLVRGDSRQL